MIITLTRPADPAATLLESILHSRHIQFRTIDSFDYPTSLTITHAFAGATHDLVLRSSTWSLPAAEIEGVWYRKPRLP